MTTTDQILSPPRRTVLAMGLSAMGLVMATGAEAAADLVDLQVIDRETGQPARVWRHAGRLYVEGRPGARYGLRVTNNSGGRVLAVMSVDGVNILTGETAGYGQRGYVVGPYGTYDVNGWRKSDTEVAAFTFAPLSRSYAARTGRPGDVGVIGLAVFAERAAPPPPPMAVSPESRARGAADSAFEARRAPAPALGAATAQAARPSERLGTGHGERERSAVTTVAFERATASPQLIRRLEYDSRENLIVAGVIPRPRPPGPPPRPRPFPAGPGYVPDPPAWR